MTQATETKTKRGRPSMRDQVAALLAKRPPLTNQQIAARLGCSANTVNEWRRKIASGVLFGATREELDRAVSNHVATRGVTKCPPAAVAPTQANPGSTFTHIQDNGDWYSGLTAAERAAMAKRAGRKSALSNAARRGGR